MEMLIATAVLALFIKHGVVDVAAMATGRTPPSHAYRMAKLRQEQRRTEADPDTRGGLKRVARHWYLDACEDLDQWRANRRKTRPERKAAKAERKQRRRDVINGLAQRLPRPASERRTPRRPQGAPEVPDNVIPLDRARRPGGQGADTPERNDSPSGDGPPEQGGPSPSTPDTHEGDAVSADTDAPATDQAGLTPHLAVLAAARRYCAETVADVDRIRAQMEAGGVGEQVTATAGDAIDAAQAADADLDKAAIALEAINRKVLEALDASNHQAGDKAYLEPEHATTSK